MEISSFERGITQRFVTTAGIARILGVSQRSAQRWAREGVFGPPAAGSRDRWARWNVDDVVARFRGGDQ